MAYQSLLGSLRLQSTLTILAIFLTLAANPLSSCLQVSGVKYITEAAPGDHISYEMGATIGADEGPMDLTVSILDWDQELSGDNIAVHPNDESASNKSYPYSAKGFLRASPSSFHLEPGESQKVTVEGDIPADVGDGGRYAIISIRGAPEKPEGSENGSTIGIGVAVNSLALITISGSDIRDVGKIESLSIMEPVSSKQQNISLLFSNSGNHHLEVKLDSDLIDKDGNILANYSLESGSSILPGSLKMMNYSFTPEKELQPGTYNILAKISMLNGTLLDTKEAEFEVKS